MRPSNPPRVASAINHALVTSSNADILSYRRRSRHGGAEAIVWPIRNSCHRLPGRFSSVVEKVLDPPRILAVSGKPR